MLSKDDFIKIFNILEEANKTPVDFNYYAIAKDFLIEKNRPEMAEGLQWLIDNNKYPRKDLPIYSWELSFQSR